MIKIIDYKQNPSLDFIKRPEDADDVSSIVSGIIDNVRKTVMPHFMSTAKNLTRQSLHLLRLLRRKSMPLSIPLMTNISKF